MTVRRIVVDHVLFVVEDLDESRRLYTAALAPLGYADAFFNAAIANGGTPRGEPGVWTQYSERYYAGFVNDLHGNNVEAVWHAPEPVKDAPMRSGVP